MRHIYGNLYPITLCNVAAFNITLGEGRRQHFINFTIQIQLMYELHNTQQIATVSEVKPCQLSLVVLSLLGAGNVTKVRAFLVSGVLPKVTWKVGDSKPSSSNGISLN